jgi:uncharacterized protein (DUF2141 family)
LTITVSGLRNDIGKVLISIYMQDPANSIAQAATDIEGGTAGAVFEGLPFGEYAVLAVHDENDNGQLDMTGEIPDEGIGYSNTFDSPQGPPVYEESKFIFSADNVGISIPVFYIDAPQ